MEKKYYMGKWELGCLIFNSLVYKIFTHYPSSFAKISGSGAWITALFTSAVFFAILLVVLHFYSPYADKGLLETISLKFGKVPSRIISAFAIVYFSASAMYAAISVCKALNAVSYVTSPVWFTGGFILLAAVIILLCGEDAVRRIHSLSAFGVGFAALLISFLSLKYADIHNLAPIFGNGADKVFGRGLSTIFLYSDALIILFLPPHNNKFSFKKTATISAIAAIIVNLAVIFAFALNTPFELAQKISIPIYPLTKTVNFGKFPLRLDTLYHMSTIISGILYLSLALCIVQKGFKAFRFKPKKIGAALLSILLCLSLCGCYDSTEIEENAYVIAIGIDKGEEEDYKYTFQISNPLESGGSIGAEEKAEEESSEKKDKNKTVDNITVEADSFFTARDKLKLLLSKNDQLTHLNLIVFSFDVAKEGALKHSELLLKEREVRPGTNLCLTSSAYEYLSSVNPTLEENTVRYYELFFDNSNVPAAPVTEIRDFVGRSLNSAHDAVVPIVSSEGLSGMGIFSDGVLKAELTPDETIIYKLLCGDLKGVAIRLEDYDYIVTSSCRPKIKVTPNADYIAVSISVKIDNALGKTDKRLQNALKAQSVAFLEKTSSLGCDVLGIGRHIRDKALTQSDWEEYNWKNKLKKCQFSVNFLP